MEKRYQIFVSSTYEDLKEERQQVTQAILELEHIPAGMEIFPASNETQWELIKKVIAESDYYVLVIGGRYGSKDTDGISYTEREYDYAVELKKPIIAFIRDNIDDVPSRKVDRNEADNRKRRAFIAKVEKKLIRKWQTPEQLGLLVTKSLTYAVRTNPQVGWVKADRAKSMEDFEKLAELQNEIDELEKENEKLHETLRNSVMPEAEFDRSLLAKGDEDFPIRISFTDSEKNKRMESVLVKWDEIFSSVGPEMYDVTINQSFMHEYLRRSLGTLVRPLIFDLVHNRNISFDMRDLDTILYQLKLLGLIMKSHTDHFMGWTLTPKGEVQLAEIKAVKTGQYATSPS